MQSNVMYHSDIMWRSIMSCRAASDTRKSRARWAQGGSHPGALLYEPPSGQAPRATRERN